MKRKTYLILYCLFTHYAVADMTESFTSQHKQEKITNFRGELKGQLQGDIDHDGRMETVGWRTFAVDDLGEYYQLVVIDDDGSILLKGPKEKRTGEPLVFSSLDFGTSIPELLVDFDNDGSLELLSPEAQSDVSPTYYRKLRWRGKYFESLVTNALMQNSKNPNRFVWCSTLDSHGVWITHLSLQNNGSIKAKVVRYTKNEQVHQGEALIRFDRNGAEVLRWLTPLPSNHSKVQHKLNGVVTGLDPYGDGYLSIRTSPNGKEIERLYNGDRVEILDSRDKWYKIKTKQSGNTGWSHNNWIEVQ